MANQSTPSVLADIRQGILNLFVGSIQQIGRFVPFLIAKSKVAKTIREQARALQALGKAMVAVGSGDAYLRQRIESLEHSGSASERVKEEEKLGLSGIQA